MKHDLDHLDLRPAFRDEPDKCHQALINAVRSVKEEEQNVKQLNFRPLLIAAIIIVSMMSAAYAASELFGLGDYWERFGISLTPAQQEALKPDKTATYEVGPMTFTLQERVADPYFAYISTKVVTADGSAALICQDAEGRIHEELRIELGLSMVERDYGNGPVHTRPTWLEAARQTGLPLYSVRARLEVAEENNGGEGMENILNTNAGFVYINQQALKNADAGSGLSCQIFLRVSQLDPNTGEVIEKWSVREPYTIPVSRLMAAGRYVAETPRVNGDMALTHIDAELYETGAYIYRRYQLPADMPLNEDYPIWDVVDATRPTDAEGNPFVRGISLTDWCNTDEWPAVSVTEMLNLTNLPEVIQVGGVNYILQSN